ncbi:MAG: carboxypeptidase-like regulatory domain-containing protein [Candidatus Dormibacteria bacterium]
MMFVVPPTRRLALALASFGTGLVLGGCAPPASASSTTGAYGHVTAGPTCPVERPDHPCPPRPVAARVDAQDGSGHTVATTTTDQAGAYSLRLPPGTYTLVVVTGSTSPRCQPTPVTVHPGGPTRADISCDTGIR